MNYIYTSDGPDANVVVDVLVLCSLTAISFVGGVPRPLDSVQVATFKMTSVFAESRGALGLTVTENVGGNKVVGAMEITGLEDIDSSLSLSVSSSSGIV